MDIRELRIGGAAACSGVWNQIIADVLGKTVVSLTCSHTEVLGAAVLAGVSVGAYPDYPAAVKRVVSLAGEFRPDPAASRAYDRLFPLYKELYVDVAPHFKRLAAMDLPEVWVTRGK
jgi:sugar (pentulose or hexulose) kinase